MGMGQKFQSIQQVGGRSGARICQLAYGLGYSLLPGTFRVCVLLRLPGKICSPLGTLCPSFEHRGIWEFTPVFRGSWMVGVALVSWSPCTQYPPTSAMRSSEARVDSRVFLAESSMKREEISSSTPTSFLAMQVYAPVSSYRTLPMCSSLPLAGGRRVLKMVCLAGTPSLTPPHAVSLLFRVVTLKTQALGEAEGSQHP